MRRILSIDRAARRPAGADFGFTLIELVVVLVLVGILGAVVAMFGSPIRAGIDGQRRTELADAADTAYRRMARDLRRALPNSIRVVGSTLEFIPTKNGGRYVDVADGSGNFLSFTDAGKLDFDFSGTDADASVAVADNDFIVIGNWGTDPANAYCSGDTCNNRAKITVSGNTATMTPSNPFPALGAEYASPGSRFQVVGGSEKAVTYDCSGGSLTRRWNYGFNGEAGGSTAVLANNIQCSFSYNQFDADLWGLIHIQFSMVSSDLPGETVTLVYQLHVDNTP